MDQRPSRPKTAVWRAVRTGATRPASGSLPNPWLAVLFDPAVGPLRAGLTVPDHLVSPATGNPAKTIAHRTYQTILGVSERTAIPVDSPYPEGAEPALVQGLLDGYSGTILICWEHHHIPALAVAIPTIPATWPGDRFDVIWSFTLSTTTDARYEFSQIPQLLLDGDSDQPIPAI